MKALKIIAVVLGALLVLTGIGLLVGASLTGAGQSALESEVSRQGLGGPVKGRVTAEDSGPSGKYFTVEFTDTDGDSRTGTGSVADNSPAPSVGDEVSVLYLLNDPDRIVIVDLGPAADFSALGNTLRIAGLISLVLGTLLLAAGIIGLVLGRKRPPPAVGPPTGYPPVPQSGPAPTYAPGPAPGPAPGSAPHAPPTGSPPGLPANSPLSSPDLGPPGPRPDYLSGPPGGS